MVNTFNTDTIDVDNIIDLTKMDEDEDNTDLNKNIPSVSLTINEVIDLIEMEDKNIEGEIRILEDNTDFNKNIPSTSKPIKHVIDLMEMEDKIMKGENSILEDNTDFNKNIPSTSQAMKQVIDLMEMEDKNMKGENSILEDNTDFNKNIPSTSKAIKQAIDLMENKNMKGEGSISEDNLDSISNDDDNDSNKRLQNSERQYCSNGWLKFVMVGKQYQADIPDCLNSQSDDQIPSTFEECSDDSEDLLLWNPSDVSEHTLTKYLTNSSTGSHIKDNESALYTLMKCKNNIRKAVRMRIQPQPLFPTPKQWSEQECSSFEDGWIRFGKNFHKIHTVFLKTRSVSEIVHFYYFWKKSARRDMLNCRTRNQKQKFAVNPGSLDMMEKFMDEEFMESFKSQSLNYSMPIILE